jgi:hypothetical protein
MVTRIDSELRCICRHKKQQHEQYQGKCDNCSCPKYQLSRSITEEQARNADLQGSMCVTPGTATPSQDLSMKVAGSDHRGSVNVSSSGLKDSGKRLQYDSGMVRDVDDTKPAFDLIIPEGVPYSELMLTRWAEQLRKGAIKYASRNWEKADSKEELDRAKASAFRHFMQWFTEENDEDHAAAVFFNINEVETIRYKQKQKENA